MKNTLPFEYFLYYISFVHLIQCVNATCCLFLRISEKCYANSGLFSVGLLHAPINPRLQPNIWGMKVKLTFRFTWFVKRKLIQHPSKKKAFFHWQHAQTTRTHTYIYPPFIYLFIKISVFYFIFYIFFKKVGQSKNNIKDIWLNPILFFAV